MAKSEFVALVTNLDLGGLTFGYSIKCILEQFPNPTTRIPILLILQLL